MLICKICTYIAGLSMVDIKKTEPGFKNKFRAVCSRKLTRFQLGYVHNNVQVTFHLADFIKFSFFYFVCLLIGLVYKLNFKSVSVFYYADFNGKRFFSRCVATPVVCWLHAKTFIFDVSFF